MFIELNLLFRICVQRQISLLQFVICFSITILILDAFEAWLKHKHRTTFLKRISNIESIRLNSTVAKFKQWINRRWVDFVFIRETNHTKVSNIVIFLVLFTCNLTMIENLYNMSIISVYI